MKCGILNFGGVWCGKAHPTCWIRRFGGDDVDGQSALIN